VNAWSEGVNAWSEGVNAWSEGVNAWSEGVNAWSECRVWASEYPFSERSVFKYISDAIEAERRNLQ
jgi:hypothetical protein